MSHPYTSDLIRSCYAAYEKKDRALLESLLSDDFTFSSPLDDNISRERYFERCWPNSEHQRKFHIEKLFVDGCEAFVNYVCETTSGTKFRNTEYFLIEDDKVKHVDVYFGRDDPQAVSEGEIRTLIHQTIAACRNKDAQALIACYAPDVIAFDLLTPLRYVGADALKVRAADWLTSFEGPLQYDLQDLKVTAGGDAGFASSLNHVRGTTKDGQKIDMWWRATLGFQKVNGSWRIAHAHNSEPFDMETGKAAVDLKP